MIIFRKTPLPIQMTNMILLEDVDGDLVYVNKDTYDQASAIFTRFDGNFGTIWKTIAGNFNKDANRELFDFCKRWRETAPEPLNVLMFAFTSLKDTKGIEWNTVSKEDMYGFMHELSLMYNFDAMTQVPAEMRASMKIPKTILTSYQTSWDSILGGLSNKVVLDERPAKPLTLADMSPEDFKEIMEMFVTKFTDALGSKSINVVAPVQAAPVQEPAPKVVYTTSPVPKPDSATHIKKQNEDAEREMNEDEKKDAAAWDQDWSSIFAEAEKKAESKPTKKETPKPQTTQTESDSDFKKTSINGTPIAKYDKEKAETSKKIFKSFGDDV